MKSAQTPDNKPVVASPTAPLDAICPYCGGRVMLRSRSRMNNESKTFFWRHQGNRNRQCSGRTSPIRQ